MSIWVGITYLQERDAIREEMEARDWKAVRESCVQLCRDTASEFVASLFQESPVAKRRLDSASNRGRTRLDLVLASWGYDVGAGEGNAPPAPIHSSCADWGIGVIELSGALQLTRGAGIQVAVLASGLSESIPSAHDLEDGEDLKTI